MSTGYVNVKSLTTGGITGSKPEESIQKNNLITIYYDQKAMGWPGGHYGGESLHLRERHMTVYHSGP